MTPKVKYTPAELDRLARADWIMDARCALRHSRANRTDTADLRAYARKCVAIARRFRHSPGAHAFTLDTTPKGGPA